MALETKVESQLREHLAGTSLGPEGASEVIAEFSRPDLSVFATRDHLDVQLLTQSHSFSRELRTEIRGLEQRTTAEFTSVRAEIRGLEQRTTAEFTSVRAEMHSEFTSVRAEIRGLEQRTTAEFTSVRAEMRAGFTQVQGEMHSLFRWSIGTTVTMFGILATLIIALR